MAVINAACQAFAPQGTSMAVLPFHHVLGFIVSILMPMHFPYPVYLNSGLRNLQQDLCAASPQTMIVVPLFIESFYKQLRSRIRQQGKEKQLAFAEAVSGFLLRFGIDIRKQMFRKIRAAFGGKLEVLICGGAEIRQEYIDFFYKYGIIILNGYGMTETASVIAVNRAGHMRPNSLGKPLSCCEIRCAEDGEIMVRGACVMNGYDGQPARSPEEWYPTGDLGRMDADGFLYFTGRKKNLIILSNGENVSPEGIEQALLRDDAVAEVIVSAENGYPEAEIYPAPQGDPQSAVDAYNAHQPPYLKIRSVKIRSAPFPKNHSGKMIR
jgi:long-chain acyl-CoA synthetase